MTPSITQDDINSALGSLLQAILPQLPAANIIVGQVNRVAEPEGDFVVMWPLRRPRLATNVESSKDAKFTGSIAATLMTITAVESGLMKVGATVFGTGVAANTTVSAQDSGTPGGVGTYTVAPSQTIASTTLSAGATEIDQSTEIVMQIDVHGPNSADNAQAISTLFRSEFAVLQMAASGVAPFFADEPRQLPFINAANQYENRWVIEAHMQAVPIVSVPQEYADSASATIETV